MAQSVKVGRDEDQEQANQDQEGARGEHYPECISENIDKYQSGAVRVSGYTARRASQGPDDVPRMPPQGRAHVMRGIPCIENPQPMEQAQRNGQRSRRKPCTPQYRGTHILMLTRSGRP